MISEEYRATIQKVACPCCGYQTLEDSGCFYICPICFWEDDTVMSHLYDYTGGANEVSLREAQQNFLKFGASARKFLPFIRQPLTNEHKDPFWQPIQTSVHDGRVWGQKLASFVKDLEKDIQLIREDTLGNKEWRIVEATKWFYDAAEWVYRVYKFPLINNNQYCDYSIEIDQQEFQDWITNQLGNWEIVKDYNDVVVE